MNNLYNTNHDRMVNDGEANSMEDDDPQLNDHPDINDPNPEDPENPGGMFLYLYHSVKLWPSFESDNKTLLRYRLLYSTF